MSSKQLLSIVITFAIYCLILNWQVATLLMVAIGFHESCHLLAARRLGLQTKGFYMLPFIGGVAFVADRYKTLAQQAIVVLAGPVGGGLLAMVTALLYVITRIPIIGAAASGMLIINAFNLLPLSQLDGGQALDTVTYSINRTLGMVCKVLSSLIAPIVLLFFNPLIAILVGGGGMLTAYKEYNNWKAYKANHYEYCDYNYLYPPKKLSAKHIVIVISVWGISALLMLVVNYMLSQCSISLMLFLSK